MSAAGRAPAVRPTSRPPPNTAIVRIDRILNRSPSSGMASVFTFRIRYSPACLAATVARGGAAIRQGRHHGAQKSTTTGRSLCPMAASNVAASGVSIGSPGGLMAPWHFPHRVSADIREYAMRFRCPQDGHFVTTPLRSSCASAIPNLPSVRDGELAGYDRSRPRQQAAPRHVAAPKKDTYEDQQLDRFGTARPRQHLPHQPENRLGNAHRPDGAIKIAPLVPFSLRGPLHARQLAEGAERPDGPRKREVRDLVNLAQSPDASDDGVHETRDVQDGESDRFAPRERVTDPAVQRVRAVFGETDDVGSRLDARQLAGEAGQAGTDQHSDHPRRHLEVEPVLEQAERHRTGRDEEHEDPDGPVVQPV